MTQQKKIPKIKKIKEELNKEFTFLKNVFSVMSLPLQMKGNMFTNTINTKVCLLVSLSSHCN